MRRASVCAGLVLAACTAMAQTTQPLEPGDLQKFDAMIDEVRQALHSGDVGKASVLSARLNSALFQHRAKNKPSPQQQLLDLEREANADPAKRFYLLQRMAAAAFEAADMARAEQYARELLTQAEGQAKNWNYGNAIYHGNAILGRITLRRDNDIAAAKEFLLAAGRTPGSPQLNSFGPNTSLAKDLLERGERDAVLQYFTLCRSFWKLGAGKLDDWTAVVKGGGIPTFGANLAY